MAGSFQKPTGGCVCPDTDRGDAQSASVPPGSAHPRLTRAAPLESARETPVPRVPRGRRRALGRHDNRPATGDVYRFSRLRGKTLHALGSNGLEPAARQGGVCKACPARLVVDGGQTSGRSRRPIDSHAMPCLKSGGGTSRDDGEVARDVELRLIEWDLTRPATVGNATAGLSWLDELG